MDADTSKVLLLGSDLYQRDSEELTYAFSGTSTRKKKEFNDVVSTGKKPVSDDSYQLKDKSGDLII